MNGLACLPECVRNVRQVLSGESCVDAGACQELVEKFLIGSFARGLVAFCALEVPRGLLEDMGIGRGGMLLLRLQDGGTAAGSGGLLANSFVWLEIWFRGWRCLPGAVPL